MAPAPRRETAAVGCHDAAAEVVVSIIEEGVMVSDDIIEDSVVIDEAEDIAACDIMLVELLELLIVVK